MQPQKRIFKLPKDKPPFIGVVFANNEKAVIAEHLIWAIQKFTLTLHLGRYPHLGLSGVSTEPYNHGIRTNYQYVTFEVSEMNEFADKALNALKVNLGHVFFDEKGILQMARTAGGKPFVIPLTKFELFDPDKHYGTQGI